MNAKFSNFIVIVYVVCTLFLRFLLEEQLGGRILVSIGLGIFAILFLWALIKTKIIRPTIFDLDAMINKPKE
jgi:hypothetical protein